MAQTIFQFGKHRGKTFEQVSSDHADYCTWACRQPRLIGQLRDFVTWLKSSGVCSRTPRCAGCSSCVDFSIMSQVEIREHGLTGWCKDCQDGFFKAPKSARKAGHASRRWLIQSIPEPKGFFHAVSLNTDKKLPLGPMLVVDGTICREDFLVKVGTSARGSVLKKPRHCCTFQEFGPYVIAAVDGYVFGLYILDGKDRSDAKNDDCAIEMVDGTKREVMDVPLRGGLSYSVEEDEYGREIGLGGLGISCIDGPLNSKLPEEDHVMQALPFHRSHCMHGCPTVLVQVRKARTMLAEVSSTFHIVQKTSPDLPGWAYHIVEHWPESRIREEVMEILKSDGAEDMTLVRMQDLVTKRYRRSLRPSKSSSLQMDRDVKATLHAHVAEIYPRCLKRARHC